MSIIGATNDDPIARIPIIEERLLISLLFLAVAIVSGVGATVVAHYTTFFAHIAEVVGLVATHLQTATWVFGIE